MDRNGIINSIRYCDNLYELLLESEAIVLYGAGQAGKEFFAAMPEEISKKVQAFVVSNLTDDMGKSLNGIKIISIDDLAKEKKIPTIVITIKKAARYEVQADLQRRGFQKVHMVAWEAWGVYNCYFGNLSHKKKEKLHSALKCWDAGENTINEIYGKMLNIGKFFASCNTEQILSNVSFTWGGSGVLDYLLLRTLAYKYKVKTYLEIGTYIGDSLTAVSDLVEKCYSISVPEDHPAHMKNWCKARHMIDYSGMLVKGENIIPVLCDSKQFPWDEFKDKVDLYFVDGDHSFQGVLVDSLNIAECMDWENDIIVWHDCRSVFVAEDVVEAIKLALGTHYENFYIFDRCMCGIYIPPKYKKDFTEVTPDDKLRTYSIKISVSEEIEQ